MVCPPSSWPSRPRHSRRLLTPPSASLDSVVAIVTSTPPAPTYYYQSNGYNPYSHAHPDPQGGYYGHDSQANDPAGSCGIKEDVWFGAQSDSPPSPFTIDSQTDSQAGGEYLPPTSDGGHDSPGQSRRANLNLNISLPPSGIHFGAGFSPASMISSGAPLTDTLSLGIDPTEDYFRFNDAALSSVSAPGENCDQIPLPQASVLQTSQSAQPTPAMQHSIPMTAPSSSGTFAYRLPASQPSSPVSGVFFSGLPPYGLSAAGRQRSTTVSGVSPFETGYQHHQFQPGPSMQPSNGSAPTSAPSSAVPSHLTFTAIHTPAATPLAQSPAVQTAMSPGMDHSFLNDVNAQAGTLNGDIQMDDATQAQMPQSRRSSGSAPGGASAGGASAAQAVAAAMGSAAAQAAMAASANDIAERLTLEKLTMLDNIVNQAQNAKAALLNGHEEQLPEALGRISNQLERAGNLGIASTPRETTPSGSSNGVNPSPTAHQTLSMGMQVPQMSGMPLSGLLPSLPVGQASNMSSTVSSPVTLNGPSMMHPGGEFMSQPPLVHSHSFPNGHQLPSQVHQGLPMPTTPVNPNTNFQAAMGMHAPMVSSPLAIIPPSRAVSPKLQQQWLPDGVSAASAAMAAATGAMMSNGHLMQPQMGQMPVPEGQKSRRSSVAEQRADGRPIVRARSSSVAKPGTLGMSSMPPSAWQSRQGSPADDDDDDDDEDDDELAHRRPKRRRSSAGPDASDLAGGQQEYSEDMRLQLDQIFIEFLNRICGDLNVTDSKGEKLHQVLMPKKMARLDESTDFRPFKFRIQAFTNAFHEELQARGIMEDTMSFKKVKTYLWRQELISRFNADGKKAKSKGNHIWHIDAKKLPGGTYVFRPFKRKIIGTVPHVAVIGSRLEWEPKIWDPMAPSASIKVAFSSPPGTLPHWLNWEDGKLVGVPTAPQPPVHVICNADFIDGANNPASLSTEFDIQIADVPQSMDAGQAAQAQFHPTHPHPHQHQHPHAPQPHPGMLPYPGMEMGTIQPSMAFGMPVYAPQPGYGG